MTTTSILRDLNPNTHAKLTEAEGLLQSPNFMKTIKAVDASGDKLTSVQCLALHLHYGELENISPAGLDHTYALMYQIALHDETLAAMVSAGLPPWGLIAGTLRTARRAIVSEMDAYSARVAAE